MYVFKGTTKRLRQMKRTTPALKLLPSVFREVGAIVAEVGKGNTLIRFKGREGYLERLLRKAMWHLGKCFHAIIIALLQQIIIFF